MDDTRVTALKLAQEAEFNAGNNDVLAIIERAEIYALFLAGKKADSPPIDWAISKRELALGPQDMKQLLRKKVNQALRQAKRYDSDGGFHYRAKQSVTLFDKEGVPVKHFFDTDHGGSPTLRQKANHQRRTSIAHDVYRAACDAEHMNKTFPQDAKLTFFLDFTNDMAEMRAADQEENDRDEDAA